MGSSDVQTIVGTNGRASLDMDQIAKALGAERRGKVVAQGGYFGAVQLGR